MVEKVLKSLEIFSKEPFCYEIEREKKIDVSVDQHCFKRASDKISCISIFTELILRIPWDMQKRKESENFNVWFE